MLMYLQLPEESTKFIWSKFENKTGYYEIFARARISNFIFWCYS